MQTLVRLDSLTMMLKVEYFLPLIHGTLSNLALYVISFGTSDQINAWRVSSLHVQVEQTKVCTCWNSFCIPKSIFQEPMIEQFFTL